MIIVVSEFNDNQYSNLSVRFINNRNISISATKLVHKKIMDWDNNDDEPKSQQEDNSKSLRENGLVVKFFNALNRDHEVIFVQDDFTIIENPNQMEQLKIYQPSNLIASLSKRQQVSTTRAGQIRVESLKFCDEGKNDIQPQKSFVDSLQCMFIHQTIPQFVYKGCNINQRDINYKVQPRIDLDSIDLEWSPITKGVYTLFLNGEQVKSRTKNIVLAGNVCPEKCSVVIQDNNKRAFFDKNLAVFTYRDDYYNVFGDIEKNLYMNNVNLFKIEVQSSKGTTLSCSPRPIDKNGVQIVEFVFETVLVDQANNDTPIIKFYVCDRLIKEMQLFINGISLEKRKRHFLKDLQKIVHTNRSFDLSVKRINFLEDLLKLENADLKKSFSVKFQDEDGIDMGGLQREYYDLVGTTMKDSRYKFFQSIIQKEEKYIFHKEFMLIRDRLRYAKIFGAILANSIANKHIIGIEFALPFIKCLYNEEINFNDLSDVIDTHSYEYLRQCSENELEMACLDFTINFNKQTYELVSGGTDISVNKKNLEQYLDQIAKFELRDKFEQLYASFKQGFESVFKIELLSKWIRPSELSIFTIGLKDITNESLLKVINYKGGNNKLINFFQQYLQHSENTTLKNFLKFTTGSSSMPFDAADYKIKVEFNLLMGTNNLPVSHTCFKSIEVPHYQSYDLMKKRLDIAFTLGSEGFGFG